MNHNTMFRVRKTVLEMLSDRNYIISEEDLNLDISDFRSRLIENKINIESHNNKNENMYVHFFLDNKSFGKKDLVNLKEYLNEKYESKNLNIIIVLKEKPTAQIKKELLNEEYNNIEIFFVKNLLFNVTKHEIIPKHEIMEDEEEIKKMLEEFQCLPRNLPKILSSDPVAKYYGMKSGQICKITRKSKVTGESIYYRLVK